jgi:hypothetical protein
MDKYQIKDRVKPLAGVYAGRIGRVDSIATDVPKCIGVVFEKAEKGELLFLTWYEPNQLEKVVNNG